AKFNAASQSVGVNVTQSAQQGGVYLSLGGATIELDQAGSFTLEIGGSLGSREVTFASGATIADVAAAINTFSDITGVFASGGTTGVSLYSSEYGSQEFVSVRNTGDAVTNPANTGLYNFSATDQFTINTTIASTFAASGTNPVRDAGQDVGGTINGIQATGDGLNLRANTDFLDVELTLGTAGSGLSSQVLGNNNAFDITGGGATFQLAGTVDIAGRVGVGISDVASRKLGTSALGFLDELGNGRTYNVVTGTNAQLATAQKIVSSSIEQVSATRGRLGAFQRNVIGATTRSLGVAVENTAAANSVIADADFAAETAQLTRSQILVQAATNTLSLANQNPQSALSLLG
ncbi:MAG: flagellin, partial [Planctomycetota bacterium]